MAQCQYIREDGSQCKLNARAGSRYCHWHSDVDRKKRRKSKPVRDPAEELRLLSGLTMIYFAFLLRDGLSLSLTLSYILIHGFRTDLVLYVCADLCSIWLYYNLLKRNLWFDKVRRGVLIICFAIVLASIYRIGLFLTLLQHNTISGGEAFLLILVEIFRITFQFIILKTVSII